MAERLSNNTNWMAQFNYDVSREFFVSQEVNTVIDGNTDLDGNWSIDSSYLEYDIENTLQETKEYGKFNAKTAKILGKTAIGASAVLVTAALVLEVMSGYTPSLGGLYTVNGENVLCMVSNNSGSSILTYSFEVYYKINSTLYVYISVGSNTTEKSYELKASSTSEGVTYAAGTYTLRINNEEEPYSFEEGYEGLYSFSVSGDYGFGLVSITSVVGHVS